MLRQCAKILGLTFVLMAYSHIAVAGAAGNMINLEEQLPPSSGGLVIDDLTYKGPALGRTNPAPAGVDPNAADPRAAVCNAFDQSNLDPERFIPSCSATSCPATYCVSMWETKCLAANCPSQCRDLKSCKPDDLKFDNSGDASLRDPPIPQPAPRRPGQPPAAADPAKPKPQTQAAGGTPAPTGNSQTDISSCQMAQQQAETCCNNPSAPECGGATAEVPPSRNDAAGLRAYCQRMREGGEASGNSNLSAAQICRQKYTSCQSTCNSMASSYHDGTASTLQGIANSCGNLQSRVATLANQSYSGYQAGGAGDVCSETTNANPMSMAQLPSFGGGGDQGGGPGTSALADACAEDPTGSGCADCSKNPGHASCKPNQISQGQGTSGFDTPRKDPTGTAGFNLPDGNDAYGDQQLANQFEPQSQSVQTIANNSGGAIPGGGGAAGGPAALGGGGKPRAPGAPGYTTDIDGGFRSGGGYSQAAGGGSGYGGEADQAGRRYAGIRADGSDASRGPASTGVDLRQYLPGGAKDPNRRLGGFANQSAQIHGKHVNMFQQISIRFQEKCRLGELYQCGG